MNVLVLHSELGVLWGGGETFTTNLFTAFAKRGHRVTATFVADHHGRYPRALPACFEPMPLSGWWSRKPGQAMLSAVGSRNARTTEARVGTGAGGGLLAYDSVAQPALRAPS